MISYTFSYMNMYTCVFVTIVITKDSVVHVYAPSISAVLMIRILKCPTLNRHCILIGNQHFCLVLYHFIG